MKAKADDLANGTQWCQTCRRWIEPVEGGHRLDHWLSEHLGELLAARDAKLVKR